MSEKPCGCKESLCPHGRIERRTGLRSEAPDRGPSIWDGLPPDWKPSGASPEKPSDAVYGPYHRWIGTLPCHLRDHPDHRDDCPGGGQGEHVKTVGSGGEDWENEYPTCWKLAAIRHTEGFGRMKERFGFGREEAERVAREVYPRRYIDVHGSPPDHVSEAA